MGRNNVIGAATQVHTTLDAVTPPEEEDSEQEGVLSVVEFID